MKKNSKGFTLMEMLIVVAIIAVLVAIAIPTFSGALTKAKEAADEANVRAYYAEVVMKNLTENEKFPSEYGGTTLNYGKDSGTNKLTWTVTDGKLEISYAATKIAPLNITATEADIK